MQENTNDLPAWLDKNITQTLQKLGSTDLDALPYTPEFETLYQSFLAMPATIVADMNRNTFWCLLNAKKSNNTSSK